MHSDNNDNNADDDSNDGTFELVKMLSKNDLRIRIIRRVGRSGLASAIKEGLLNATGDFVALMDADGQHQPNDVLNAINYLDCLYFLEEI